MTHFKKIYLINFFLATLLLVGCTTPPLEADQQEDRIPVRTSQIEIGSFQQTIELAGRTRSRTDFPLVSLAPLQISKVYVNLGDVVKKGDTLVQFNNTEVVSQLEETKRAVERLTAQKQELEQLAAEAQRVQQMVLAEREQALARAQAILAGAQTGAVTMLDLLQASAELLLLQAQGLEIPSMPDAFNQAAIEGQLEQARAQVKLAEQSLEQLTIKAPFDGTITLLNAERDGISLPNTPILQISDLNELMIDLQVGGSLISKLKQGQAVQLWFEQPISPLETTLTAFSPGISQTGQQTFYQALIRIDNSEGLYFPGMNVRAVVDTFGVDNVLLVPIDAVFFVEGKSYVYTLSDDRAFRRNVTLGERNQTHYMLLEGLEEGATVVISGKERLSDNRIVLIQ